MKTLPLILVPILLLGACHARKADPVPPPAGEVLEPDTMQPAAPPGPTLPAQVGDWTLSGEVQTIGPDGLFDYMNGAGELYLAYRFERLEVRRYAAEDGPEILLETYHMVTPDDAFGLLSWDWSGEAWRAGPIRAESHRALYEGGLLRIACGDTFHRMQAAEDTEAVRAALHQLADALGMACGGVPVPRITNHLPAAIGAGEGAMQFRADRVVFLRSPLVLNEAYFLAWDNILALDLEVDAVYGEYRSGSGEDHVRVVLVRYPDAGAAEAALASFRGAYLAEPLEQVVQVEGQCEHARVEDGWTGFHRQEETLALVFEATDSAQAQQVLDRLIRTRGSEEAVDAE